MTVPTEIFELTPIGSTSDSGIFDFDELEVKIPSVEDSEKAREALQYREYRGRMPRKGSGWLS